MKRKNIFPLLLALILASSAMTVGCKKEKDPPKTPDQNITDDGGNTNIPEDNPPENSDDGKNDAETGAPSDELPGGENSGDGGEEGGENNDGENENNTPTSKDKLEFSSNGSGTCTLVGLGSYSDACIVIPETNSKGETVVAIGERAFYGCDDITAVQIPASVERIGASAFGDCENLIYIGVSTQNENFKDVGGILYSSDGREIICYPSAKAGSYVTIGDDVTKIHAMAFYKCKYLNTIYYCGDYEDWDRINLGEKNYSLTAASIQYSANGK